MLGRTALGAVLVALLGGCPAATGQGGGTGGGGGGGAGGGTACMPLTSEQLEEVDRTLSGVGKDAILRCFNEEMERQKDKKLTGHVMIKLLIGTNRVEQVVLGENTLHGSEFKTCVIDAVKSLDFPAIRTPTWYTRAFDLSPQY
jgi:hypothetical protein